MHIDMHTGYGWAMEYFNSFGVLKLVYIEFSLVLTSMLRMLYVAEYRLRQWVGYQSRLKLSLFTVGWAERPPIGHGQ